MWMRIRRALVVALPSLFVATAMSAQQSRSGESGLTVYSEPQYRGLQQTLRADTPNLTAVGADDRVSSVKVDGSDGWELCAEANYTGRCVVLSNSEADLGRRGWSNHVSSARRVHGTSSTVTGTSLSGIVLFSEPQLRGDSTRIDAVQWSSGAGNAAPVRSLRVRAGTWEVCELASFRGRCALIAGDIADVRSLGLADGVGSARLHVKLR
jgi:hypothetical protein